MNVNGNVSTCTTSNGVKNAACIYQDEVDETIPIINCLKKLFEISFKNTNTRIKLKRFCTSTSCHDNVKLYLVKERFCNSKIIYNNSAESGINDSSSGSNDGDTTTKTSNESTEKYVYLDNTKPLKELFKNEIIVEFPNVLVYVNGEQLAPRVEL